MYRTVRMLSGRYAVVSTVVDELAAENLSFADAEALCLRLNNVAGITIAAIESLFQRGVRQ